MIPAISDQLALQEGQLPLLLDELLPLLFLQLLLRTELLLIVSRCSLRFSCIRSMLRLILTLELLLEQLLLLLLLELLLLLLQQLIVTVHGTFLMVVVLVVMRRVLLLHHLTLHLTLNLPLVCAVFRRSDDNRIGNRSEGFFHFGFIQAIRMSKDVGWR